MWGMDSNLALSQDLLLRPRVNVVIDGVYYLPFSIYLLKFLHGRHRHQTWNGDALSRKQTQPWVVAMPFPINFELLLCTGS